LCQASQNIHRHSNKIKIQWLGLAAEANASKDLYLPEYYDTTEFGTILTSVELNKQKGKKLFQLSKSELDRIENILKKAIDKETGKLKLNDKSLTEDNPDGLDISIYKDEDQLEELERKKKKAERKQKPTTTPKKPPAAKKPKTKSPPKKKFPAMEKAKKMAKTSTAGSTAKKAKSKPVIDEYESEDQEEEEIMPTPKKRGSLPYPKQTFKI
jgi:hypothetical protein